MKLENAISMLLWFAGFLFMLLVLVNTDFKPISINLNHSGAVICYDYNVN